MYQTAHQNDGFNALRLCCSKLNSACLCYDQQNFTRHDERFKEGIPGENSNNYSHQGFLQTMVKFSMLRNSKPLEFLH